MRQLLTLGLALTLGLTACTGCAPKTATVHSHGEDGEHSHGEGEPHGKEHAHQHGGEDHEREEGFVVLSAAQRQEIGLSLAAPVTAPGSGASRTGRVEADPDRAVVISPQVAGTIRDLPVIIGSRVERGAVVAVVESPEIAILKGEYHNAEVEMDLAAKELANKKALFAFGDESRRELEQASLELSQAKALRDAAKARLANAKLQHERLLSLEKEGIASTQQVEQAATERRVLEAELGAATSAISIAEQHLARERSIANSQLRQKSETFPAEANLARARENHKHLEERLLQLGADLGESGSVTLRSPIEGQVIKRPVNRGQAVGPGDILAELVDPSQVWVMIDLTRTDLNTVRLGDPVTISLANDSQVTAHGELSHIDPQVEAESQTVRARVELKQTGEKFRLGSFVNARFGGTSQRPTLPKEAVQEVEGETVVYLAEGEGFRRTAVKVVFQDAQNVQLENLELKSQVVVKGAADLKSLDLSGTIGGHQH